MAYVAPADFREQTRKPWTQGLLLDESLVDDYFEDVIALVQERIDDELGDTFEPPSPDDDITLDLNAYGGRRLYLPRRIRSITSVSTRDLNGTLTAEAATLWRATSSLTGGEFADGPYDYLELIPGQYLSTGWWPYGAQTVQVVGKFGWPAPPDDIKRLTALYVYDYVKPKDHPLTNVESRTTLEGTIVYGPSEEIERIRDRYRRKAVLVG